MAIDTNKGYVVHPWFHMLLITITSFLLTATIYYDLQFFETYEPTEQLIQLTPEQQKAYGGNPAHVTSGLYIVDFSDFDMVKGKFAIDLVLWFKYNPSDISKEKLDTFIFEKADTKSRMDPIINTIGNQSIIQYKLHINLTMPLNFKNFPLDDHRINIAIINPALSPTDIILETSNDDIFLGPETQPEGWALFDKDARAGYAAHPIKIKNVDGLDILHPRAVFSLDFERSGARQVASIFLPLLVIFFTTLLTFSIEPSGGDFYNVIAMSSTSILALIAYRFVIETISPATGYFTLSDYMFIFFLLATSLILFINTLGTNITGRTKSIMTIIFHGITIAFFVYLFIG